MVVLQEFDEASRATARLAAKADAAAPADEVDASTVYAKTEPTSGRENHTHRLEIHAQALPF